MKLNYTTPVTRLDGTETTLEDYRGQVLLIVNTASKCGLTPQYKGLEQIWQELGDSGLTILGFPCDQFGKQEFSEDTEIASFCAINYGVSFPMHSRIDVNGGTAHPLFRQLKDAAPGLLGSRAVKWNFTKFLVDHEGNIIERFSPRTPPEAVRVRLEELLEERLTAVA
jgi:glutathione peroxidase